MCHPGTCHPCLDMFSSPGLKPILKPIAFLPFGEPRSRDVVLIAEGIYCNRLLFHPSCCPSSGTPGSPSVGWPVWGFPAGKARLQGPKREVSVWQRDAASSQG